MANSTTNIDTVVASQASKEVTINAAFDAASQAMTYGRRASTCSGLTWGYYGGNVVKTDGTMAQIANGTLTLTASNTNYIVALKSTGAVSVSTATTNWNDTENYWRLYSVVAGTASLTSYTDYRDFGQRPATALSIPASSKTTPVDADYTVIADTEASSVLKRLTWANIKATLKTYFDTLYALKGAITTSALTMSTGKILGRTTAGVGAVEEIDFGQFPATSTNDNASAGKVGEYVTAQVLSGSAVSLTTATTANITSIELSAGDWDVTCIGVFTTAASTSFSAMICGASATSATLPDIQNRGNYGLSANVPGVINNTVQVPPVRFSLASTTTIYLVSRATFTESTMVAYGRISARRVR